MNVLLRVVTAGAVGLATLLLPGTPAQAATSAVAPVAVAELGSSAATAAASCWEIKQLRPDASDGAYWLVTSEMAEPQELYCDMTTDGGGWVLVAEGRDGFVEDYLGQNNASRLTTAGPDGQMTTTVQLSARKVDQLLGGQRPDALQDGIRLKRARDAAGTAWQEVRLGVTAKKDRWSWTFGSEQPMSWYSFDGVRTTSNATTSNFGTDNNFNRVYSMEEVSRGYKIGFGYGSGVQGTTNDTTYLWSRAGGGPAIPYTEVYLRPKLTTYDSSFTQIANSGTAAETGPKTLRNAALTTPWGVAERPGSTAEEISVETQAFTQSGNTMFVGGNFRYVQRDANGTGRVEQPFLAGFDVTTGELVSSFRPQLNEQVRALETLPDGTVVAGGDFTQANGQPATAIVGLDPVTGATRPSFRLSMENRITGGNLRVRSLNVEGEWLYVGGALTHFTGGPSNVSSYMRNLGRVSLNGTPSTDWKPNFSGTVADTNASEDGSRIYAAGYFTTTGDGSAASNAAAVRANGSGELATPAWNPTWSSPVSYQQSIVEAADRVWVGGSEHSWFSFDKNSLERLSGNITKDHGDFQAEAVSGNMVFAGCHCSEWSYENAYTWRNLNSGWSRTDNIEWFGQWDATTGARVPDFTPRLNMRNGNGVWALEVDSLGNVWAGGDIATVRTASGNRFSGGFARFTEADSTAPTTPGNVQVTAQTASTVTLGWGNSTDQGGGVRYQILRDDRPVGFTSGNTRSITVPKGGNNRFFVRATDAAGNLSASSPVVSVDAIGAVPTADFSHTAQRATASFDAASSAAGGGSITAHDWVFGDGTGDASSAPSHTYASAGQKVVWLTVLNSQGGTDTVSKVISVKAAALQAAPADEYGALIFDQDPWAYYRLGETTGTTAADAGPDARAGTYIGSSTRGLPGALAGVSNTAIQPASTDGGAVVSPRLTSAPGEFSVGIWFRTSSTSGGRLIGYGNSSTGISSNYDRKIQMQNDGKLVFGVYTGTEARVTSAASYNDNAWHYAVATQGPAGMRLYVDGVDVGSNPATTGQNYLGAWRVGTDAVWAGATSRNFGGTLDEAAIFDRVLTPAEVARQHQVGSGAAPVNQPPVASFSAEVEDLGLSVDGSASADVDGTIASYAWDFGDGNAGAGQTAAHVYEEAGTYTVRLTVVDNQGASHSVTSEVTAEEPPSEPVTSTIVERGSVWNWRYEAGAPASNWNAPNFDASAWNRGAGVLGFGAPTVQTNIDTFAQASQRPLAAYFTRSFQAPGGGQPTALTINSVADDGAVFYVNGTEVARQNMRAGAVTPSSYAQSSRRYTVANANPVRVEVPASLLRAGTNVIAVESHVNYRATPDVTFDLDAELTYLPSGVAPENQAPVANFSHSSRGLDVSVDAGASADPDGSIERYDWDFGDGATATGRTADHTYSAADTYTVTLTVTDNQGATTSTTTQVMVVELPAGDREATVIERGAGWSWRYAAGDPPSGWNSPTFDASSWNLGAGVLGFGTPTVVTNIDTFAQTSQRPLAAYFTRSFELPTTPDGVATMTLSSAANDGAVFYVNGTEVARQNMPSGAITSRTYASSARRYLVAEANPVELEVPATLLRAGTNVVSVESHVNYRATPDVTFDLEAKVTY